MAKVYLASYEGPGDFRRLVVLKCLKRRLAADTQMREAFMAEARLTARLNHPNIVQVREVIEADGIPIMAMEYLDGYALSEVLKCPKGPFERATHLYVLTEVLRGLHYFHELEDDQGRPLRPIHRDLSPHNIFITQEGTIKVLDFGVAKSESLQPENTATGVVKGKLRYMAPEQLSGADMDRRTDLFAVGIMLWEALSGERLYAGKNDGEIMRMLLDCEIPSIRAAAPDLPEPFYEAIEKTLTATPSARLSTAREMRQLLLQGLSEMNVTRDQDTVRELMRGCFGEELTAKRKSISRRLTSHESRWSTAPPAPAGISTTPPSYAKSPPIVPLEPTVAYPPDNNEANSSSKQRPSSQQHASNDSVTIRHALPSDTLVDRILVGGDDELPAPAVEARPEAAERRLEPRDSRPAQVARATPLLWVTAAAILVAGAAVALLLIRTDESQDPLAPDAAPHANSQPEASSSPSKNGLATEQAANGSTNPTSRAAAKNVTLPQKPALKPAPACSRDNLLDDFEDGDGALCGSRGRIGNWTLYFDGTGELTPSPGFFTEVSRLEPPRGSSLWGLRFRGTSLSDWGAGVAVAFRDGAPLDLTHHKGLHMWVHSPVPVKVQARIATLDTLSATYGGRCELEGSKNCDDHFGISRTIGPGWYHLRVDLSELRQSGWGVEKKWDPADAVEFHFNVRTDKQPIDFDITLDDVEFF